MPVTPTIEVDDTLKERSSHGSFELPIETYTDNCEIFHSLYNHWHDEMELIYIESGSGLVRLNKEILRVKAGDLIIVNRGVLHGIKTDLKNILYFRSIVFDLNFLSGPAGDLCQERVISLLMDNQSSGLSAHSTLVVVVPPIWPSSPIISNNRTIVPQISAVLPIEASALTGWAKNRATLITL